MKKLLYFCVLAASLLIIQCSNEIPVTTNPINLELGKVSLKIDKANAPAEVVLVEAFLTREGYDTLYGVLNIVSSTSADITFEEVSAGDWPRPEGGHGPGDLGDARGGPGALRLLHELAERPADLCRPRQRRCLGQPGSVRARCTGPSARRRQRRRAPSPPAVGDPRL